MTASPEHDTAWSLAAAAVDDPDADRLLRQYLTDVLTRYHGRPATAAEITAMLGEEPREAFTPPRGAFFLARYRGAAAGCVGLRLLRQGVAEIKRMFVHPDYRGRHGGAYLLHAAEGHARRDLGATTVRLDTRTSLAEARGLYTSRGYREIPRYNENPYAQHWYEKHLT